MDWVYNISTSLLAVICIFAYSLLGVGGIFLSRPWVRRLHRTDHSHNDVVSYFFAAASVFYGVTLGLITIGVWTNYTNAQDKVDREAQAIASMYRTAEGFDTAHRLLLQRDLMDYTNQVIHVSWPQQKSGMPSIGSGLMLETMQRHILAFTPQTPADQILQTQILTQFNNLADAKHARMDSVGVGIPSAMWSLVLLGAAITLAITWCFDLPSVAMHVWMTFMLACLVGLIIALTAAFDNPFRGDLSVPADTLVRVYAQMAAGLKAIPSTR